MPKKMRLPNYARKKAGGSSRIIHTTPKLADETHPLHPLLHLQQSLGNQAIGRLLQTKLKVNHPGDEYEQEADRVADAVMRMPGPQIQRQAAEEEEEPVQTKKISGDIPEVTPELEAQINALKGGGQPLPHSVRAFFEPRFGVDFSDVRVHANDRAAESAKAINARAFTVGRDMAFGNGQFAPETSEGRRLLAHELTHVIQQDGPTTTLRNKRIEVQKIGQPMVQGGFFGKIWKGIKKGAKAVGKWGWNVLKSAGAWAWSLVTKGPQRLWRLLKHVGGGVAGIFKWLWEGIKTVRGIKSFAQWIGRGIVSGAAWAGKLVAKLLDVVGFGELVELIWQIIKFNTRTLTSTEIAEAKKVFGNSIKYWQVRIDEYSLIAWIGSLFKGGGGLGVTTFHTINFNRKIKTAPGNSDMAWLIHELTHVSQYEHVGSQYMGEAIHAQATTGYGYGGEAGLLADRAAGKHFRDYNREQQGDIARDYYLALTSGRSTAAFDPFIAELRAGKL
jgi:hypothetical protein